MSNQIEMPQSEPASGLSIAPITLRVKAVALDHLVMAVMWSILDVLIPHDPRTLIKMPLVVLTATFVYYVVANGPPGQSIGKRIVGIRVVRVNGHRTDWTTGLVRTLGLVLSIVGWIGFLMAVADQKHRGLHDRLAGTMVVRAAR